MDFSTARSLGWRQQSASQQVFMDARVDTGGHTGGVLRGAQAPANSLQLADWPPSRSDFRKETWSK